MVAAVTFNHSRNLSDLTNAQQGELAPDESTDLSQGITVYLRDKGDDLLPIVIDSGASNSLTANYIDFIGSICPATITELQGLSHTRKVHRVGKVEWTVSEQQKGHLSLDHSSTTLQLRDRSPLQFPYNANSNLLLMLPALPHHIRLTFDDATTLGDGHSVHNNMSVADKSNQNLTSAQKKLLLWHWKLGHTHLQFMQTLCRDPTTSHRRFMLETHHNKMSSCMLPKCAAYMLSKQMHHTPGTNSGALVKGKEMMLRHEHLQPGNCVSLNQYESSIPGCLPHTYGKEKKGDQYYGGTLFVDHASSMVFIQHQVSL